MIRRAHRWAGSRRRRSRGSTRAACWCVGDSTIVPPCPLAKPVSPVVGLRPLGPLPPRRPRLREASRREMRRQAASQRPANPQAASRQAASRRAASPCSRRGPRRCRPRRKRAPRKSRRSLAKTCVARLSDQGASHGVAQGGAPREPRGGAQQDRLRRGTARHDAHLGRVAGNARRGRHEGEPHRDVVQHRHRARVESVVVADGMRGYEQARGQRLVHEKPTGFEVSISRTIEATA